MLPSPCLAPRPLGLTPAGVETQVNLAYQSVLAVREAQIWTNKMSASSSAVSFTTAACHMTASRAWGGPSDGETCDACDTRLLKVQLVMEGSTLARRHLQFHVRCFQLWDAERRN